MPFTDGGSIAMADDAVTLGEVYRMIERVSVDLNALREDVKQRSHALNNSLQTMVAPMSALGVRMNNAEENIDKLDKKVDGVLQKSAMLSGGIGVVAFLSQWFHK